MPTTKTSISCNPLTLGWANKLRRMYMFLWDREVTLDETIFTTCSFVHWLNARYNTNSTELDLPEYVVEKMPLILAGLNEEELVELKAVFEGYMEQQKRIEFYKGFIKNAKR